MHSPGRPAGSSKRSRLEQTIIMGPGTRLGRYEIITHLANGGMASVYLARMIGAAGFHRLVAVKRLHGHIAGDAEFVAMFMDEARLAARIRHPNVVPTLDLENGDDGPYLAMEFVEGDSLLGLLKNAAKRGEPLPASIALRIMIDALHGLDAAHELKDDRGEPLHLVHRDVSPHNILVGLDGVARITDFGVAHAEARVTHTRDGQIKGKLSYMAPEMTTGEPFDRRADLFSAAVVLWETLAARRLFKGATDVEILRQLSIAPIPHLRDIDPNIPRSLEAVVARALERDPAARYPTAAEFADDLESAGVAVGIASPRAVATYVRTVSAERIAEIEATVRAWTEDQGNPRLVVIPGDAPTEHAADVADTAVRDTINHHAAPAITEAPDLARPRSARRSLMIAVLAAGLVVLGALIAILTLNAAGQDSGPTPSVASAPRPPIIVAATTPIPTVTSLPVTSAKPADVVQLGAPSRVLHTTEAPRAFVPPPDPPPIASVSPPIASAPLVPQPSAPPIVTQKPAPSSTSFNPEAM